MTKECLKLAEALNTPVITTYMAKGGIPVDHPLNAGHCGIKVGMPIGNKVFLEADLVLGIGCRFTDRHTGALDVYRGNRRFIHINIDPGEIGKIFPADLGIVADARGAIPGGVEGQGEGFHHLVLVGDAPGALGHRSADTGDIHALEGVPAQLGRHGLAGNGQQGNAVDMGRVEAGDEICGAGPGGAERRRHFPTGAVIPARRVHTGLLVPVAIVAETAVPHVFIQSIDTRARNSKAIGYAFFFQDLDNCL